MEFYNGVGADSLKPSLFELVAQEQLRDLLQPALKYVLSVFAQQYPRYLLRLVNKHEEFYALMMLFVEKHYLRAYGASFAENFYGLKRRRRPLFETERARAAVGGVPEEEKLRSREIRRSLLFLVGLPYLRAKAQDYYESLGGGLDPDILHDGSEERRLPDQSHQTLSARFQQAYKKIYPWLNISFDVWLTIYNIAYLFDRTPFYRPWLSYIGVDLRRIGVEDMRAISQTSQKQHQKLPEGILATMRYLVKRWPRLLLDSLKVLLPMAIFFIKFLEWWYSPSSPARSLDVSPHGPPVPPPKLLVPHPQGLQVDTHSYGQCPICRGAIVNATALPSGYVFCYRCAHQHVEKSGTCPVTLMPVRMWQLRKILV